MISEIGALCPLCGGRKREGKTTFTLDCRETVIVIRDVPATVCALCGHEWIADDVAEGLEGMVNDARERKPFVEITKYRKVVWSSKVMP
jgi:YgiT-type zinc finger domain-containing protein